MDLRKRIIKALEVEPSSLVVAERFDVSASAVRKLRLRFKRTGNIEPSPYPGRERLIQGKHEHRLAQLVLKHPDATLKTLCELLASETQVLVSETTAWRQLRRMGITLKKNAASHRTRPSRRG